LTKQEGDAKLDLNAQIGSKMPDFDEILQGESIL